MTIDPNNLSGTAHLTFDDEFNTLSLWNGSSGTWDTNAAWEAVDTNGYTLASNGEQEWYINNNYGPTSSVSPWTASNGVLSLTGAQASPGIQSQIDNYQYTSGQLNTSKSFSQEYGYFEVNAKLPSGQGFWPAFWLLPENGSWPPELDVMENLGNNTSTYYTTVHYNADNESQSSAINTGVNLSTSFNTYAVDWEPDYITWYFDGKEVYQAATPSDMNSPMYMILNLALGGTWPGSMDASALPGSMDVDWVKVYADGPSSTGTTSGTGTTTTTTSSGTTTSSAPTVLTAPNDSGTTLTAGSGAYTLIASHGPDVLVAGSGPDTFEFPAIPWSAGQIEGFNPSQDVLDLAPIFQAAGYTGSNPVGDGWLSFAADAHGDTQVYFNPHDGSNSGNAYLITTLDGVLPSSINVSQDVIFSASSGTGSATTTSGGGGAAHTLALEAGADFNGSGLGDIVWFNASTDQETVWQATGSSFQGEGTQSAPAGWTPVGAGDFSADGKSDMLWFDSATDQVSLWHSTGSGFQGAGEWGAPSGWSPITTGDFNGDGKSDILWFDSGTNQESVWQSTGSGFQGAGVEGAPAGWAPAGAGDFNGDGKSDVLWFDASTHQVSIWDSTGSSFQGIGVAGAPAGWAPDAIGDFNGDGKSDIFWFDAATGQATVWQNTGSSFVGTGVTNVPAGWTPIGVGDFNGDGKDDVYWFNATTHQVSVWDSTGSGFQGIGVEGAPAGWAPVPSAIDGLHLA